MRYSIVKGIRDILWGSAWADHVEDAGCCNLSGCKIEDHMPEAPPEAHTAAEKVATEIEAANGVDLETLVHCAALADSDGGDDDCDSDYAEHFGNCLAFMAQGAGVSWFDDHEKLNLTVPYTDAHNDLDYIALTTCDECRALQVDLTDYGVDGASYFQGHGCSFTEYEHSALGVGDNFAEALDDAIEQACSGVDGPDHDKLVRAIKSYFPDAYDTQTEGWHAEVNAHDECDIVCHCGKILSEVKDAEGDGVHWEAGCDDSRTCEGTDDDHEPDDSAHENYCELHYHVGLRW